MIDSQLIWLIFHVFILVYWLGADITVFYGSTQLINKKNTRRVSNFVVKSILENKISRAEVINTRVLSGDKIIFGSTVTLGQVGRKKNIVYQIVGTEEADVENGKISVSSPLARALLGKKIDDLVEVSSPGGSKEYEIENIEFV